MRGLEADATAAAQLYLYPLSQERRRAAALVAVSQLQVTQSSIDRQRTIAADAEETAALARKLAEDEYALATAKRNNALKVAGQTLASANETTSAEIMRLRALLDEQEEAVEAFSDVLEPQELAALGIGGVVEGGGAGSSLPACAASARGARAAESV